MMEDNSRGLHFRCHSLPLPQVFSCPHCGGSIWIILAIGIWSLRDKRSVPGGTAETFLCQWAPADGSGNAVISYTDTGLMWWTFLSLILEGRIWL